MEQIHSSWQAQYIKNLNKPLLVIVSEQVNCISLLFLYFTFLHSFLLPAYVKQIISITDKSTQVILH